MGNVKLENGKVYINTEDLGWHCAGSIEDAKANYPLYAEVITQLLKE